MKNLINIVAIAMMAANASSIVVQDYAVAETSPDGLDWSYVYDYKGSTAVAVGGRWILTAGHVADDAGSGILSIDGTTYTQQEIVYHSTADLALVRYDRPFPGQYPLYTGNVVGLEVILVGMGNTGSAFSNYWTMSGTGRGVQRWGSQRIDRTRNNQYYAGGTVGFTQNLGFWMDFYLGNTSHEAGTSAGDSGSGVFYEDGGIWKLAGLTTAVSGSGGDFDSTFAITIANYYSWIVDTVTATGSDDADGDGLTNEEESLLGTNPMSADTDEDLISDPLELNNGLDPLVSNVGMDSDADGLLDTDEVVILGTDPLDADSDHDGLSDSVEVNTTWTDPLLKDTDMDGLMDGEEVNIYYTLPDNPDSDGDVTTDWEEIFVYSTDPNDPGSDFDLDDDEIADTWETANFTSIENCNPTNDPDGDYYLNLAEFENDTDPNAFDVYVTLRSALAMEWNATTGAMYQAQMSTNLLSGEWINLGDPVAGDNSKHTVPLSIRENVCRFYRVIDANTTLEKASELEWNTAPEVVYLPQISTNLTSGIWYDLGAPVVGDGQTHYLIDTAHPGVEKAYRIQIIVPL